MRLKDKVSIVTGAAQGIGAAIARRFAEEGSCVILGDLLQERGEATAAQIRAAGGQAAFVRCDVADAAAAPLLIKAAVETYGSLDTCVCAAGIGTMYDFLKMTRGEFERVLSINLTAPFLLSQAAATQWVAAGRHGSIIHISSVSSLLANDGQAAYCASKAGLGGLTRATAVSLAPFGIRVNAIAPGPTYTAQSAAAFDDPAYGPLILSRTPLGRFAQPDEMSGAAVFLASDDASFVTGETIFVDGGRLALNYVMPPSGSKK